MAKRPVVAVTGPDRGGWVAWAFTALAVWRAGGRPLRIRPGRSRIRNDRLPGIDALVLGGGADVDPGRYGQNPVRLRKELAAEKRHPGHFLIGLILFPFIHILRKLFSLAGSPGPDPKRDALEERFINHALNEHLPVLGICRGMQFLNVRFGGTLHQDLSVLEEERPNLRTLLPRKPVTLLPGSLLHTVFQKDETRVNALHHQAVDRLGEGFRVTARERGGVVQALEHSAVYWLVGVQWHPEFLPHKRRQQALFRALVRAAQEKSPFRK